MAEWLKAHAWKACTLQKGVEGSNPSLSASLHSQPDKSEGCRAKVKHRPAGTMTVAALPPGKPVQIFTWFFPASISMIRAGASSFCRRRAIVFMCGSM